MEGKEDALQEPDTSGGEPGYLKVEREGTATAHGHGHAGFIWPHGQMGRKLCHEISLPGRRDAPGVSCLIMKAQGTHALWRLVLQILENNFGSKFKLR